MEELDINQEKFLIHIGNNTWIETDSIFKDYTGTYTLECNILKSCKDSPTMEYKRTWKCPYCHQNWPIGIKCQNEECPSKYK